MARRYVPNLIPKPNKVLPDYFKGNPYASGNSTLLIPIISYILALSTFIVAFASLQHLLLSFIYLLLGFVILPPGHVFIEKRLRFQLKPIAKTIFCTALIILSTPLLKYYTAADKAKYALEQAALWEQEKKQMAVDAEKRQQEILRKNNFTHYLQAAETQLQHNNEDGALTLADSALNIAEGGTEQNEVQQLKMKAHRRHLNTLVTSGKYQEAIGGLNTLLAGNPDDTALLLNRAICYSKTQKTREAVADLKMAMQYNCRGAQKYYNKINPIRRRIIGYETLCCDGTTSYATGRGACSWHGGVCEWNHPIYEEYRKYE